jgi:hypothetical protein
MIKDCRAQDLHFDPYKSFCSKIFYLFDPYILYPKSSTLTLNPKPFTSNVDGRPSVSVLYPKPWTLHPKP